MVTPLREEDPFPHSTSTGMLLAQRRGLRSGRGRRRPVTSWTFCSLADASVDAVALAAPVLDAGYGALLAGMAVGLLLLLNLAGGTYRIRLSPSLTDGWSWRGGCVTAIACVLTVAALEHEAALVVRAGEVALVVVPYLGLTLTGRGLVYVVLRQARRRGVRVPTLVAGSGAHARHLALTLLRHSEYGLAPVGGACDVLGQASCTPLVDDPEKLLAMARRHRARVVLLAPPPGGEEHSHRLAQQARQAGYPVYLAPQPGGVLVDFVSGAEHIRGFPVLRMRPLPQQRLSWPLKRALDVVLAVAGLVVSAPVLAVCMLLLRRQGGPGVLFRQVRVGIAGTPIEIVKLRTFAPLRAGESDTRWSIDDDPRLTRTARLMRSCSLDELPQLWNVLRGDMSLVGPRPERPHFVELFSRADHHYGRRHRLPVGLTGWAQTHGLRGDTSIEDRARLDNHYIDTWSLRRDIKIMIRTVGCLLWPGRS
ncbi:hypothetical protein GCM10010176_047390 [Nonomuraea spiralis]|nr:hypothetical protein GCM10010176_047390 [Nonomuraea spiralis]